MSSRVTGYPSFFFIILLGQAGYTFTYFSADSANLLSGFVIATRFERIRDDGVIFPDPYRYAGDKELPLWKENEYGKAANERAWFPELYFQSVFTAAPPGYYRLIAFQATNSSVPFGDKPPTYDQLDNLLLQGRDRLPPELSEIKIEQNFLCEALIFEVTKERDGSVYNDKRLDAKVHLIKSGIWKALGLKPDRTTSRAE